tara:strand:+ start:318 stop:542 length:225 start_codon:yes stop_codon:yes gene_type:complete
MAAKGTSGVSSSGASMSKYDVEVEARLKALESHSHGGGGGSGDKVDKLIEILNGIKSITDYCAKNEDGVRKIEL